MWSAVIIELYITTDGIPSTFDVLEHMHAIDLFHLDNSVVKGSNIFNEGFSTKSVQGNQDYHMNIKQDWASASISIIYKIGKYKEKTTKDVDTSRMGVN